MVTRTASVGLACTGVNGRCRMRSALPALDVVRPRCSLVARPLLSTFVHRAAPASPEVSMYALGPAPAQDLADNVVQMTHLGGVALLAGWLAERTVDTGFRVRGLALLAGAIGCYAGSSLWEMAGWEAGPVVWGYAILPAL